jgi:hypothetical protein
MALPIPEAPPVTTTVRCCMSISAPSGRCHPDGMFPEPVTPVNHAAVERICG